jgi:S1-C subfamily serine protease
VGTTVRSARIAVLLLLALPEIACQGGTGSPAYAQLTSQRIFAQSRSAVVLVYAEFSSQVTIPSAVISPAQQSALQRTIDAEAAAGHLDQTNSQAVLVATLEETAANILSYFNPSPDPSTLRQVPGQVTTTSSGFIVSRDGVVLTSAHAVATGMDVLKTLMVRQAVAAFVPFISVPDSVPADTKQRVTEAQQRWAAKYAEVGQITTKLIVFTGPSIAGPLKASQGTTAEPLAAADSGMDVAAVRLQGHRTWPTIVLGNDGGLGVGDRVYVIGYPATATLDQPLTPAASFVSRMMQGTVSGRPEAAGGRAIAMDAAATPGDSGGPVLDSNGKVVGLVSSGSIDPVTGTEVAGPVVGVPVSAVRTFLTAAKVKAS